METKMLGPEACPEWGAGGDPAFVAAGGGGGGLLGEAACSNYSSEGQSGRGTKGLEETETGPLMGTCSNPRNEMLRA